MFQGGGVNVMCAKLRKQTENVYVVLRLTTSNIKKLSRYIFLSFFL